MLLKSHAFFLKKQSGFTYVGVLFLVFLLGLNLSLASTLYSFNQQREKEQQLIFIGNQFRRAIAEYYLKSPGTVKKYPQKLEDLLSDNRFVNTQRHLRKIYLDPISLERSWGIIPAPEGGIMGIYSLSNQQVLKASNFNLVDLNLNGQLRYSDWKFLFAPAINPILPAATNQF